VSHGAFVIRAVDGLGDEAARNADVLSSTGWLAWQSWLVTFVARETKCAGASGSRRESITLRPGNEDDETRVIDRATGGINKTGCGFCNGDLSSSSRGVGDTGFGRESCTRVRLIVIAIAIAAVSIAEASERASERLSLLCRVPRSYATHVGGDEKLYDTMVGRLFLYPSRRQSSGWVFVRTKCGDEVLAIRGLCMH
jgi:hypothetical protein